VKVAISLAARADLRGIGDYIAAFDPVRGRRFVSALITAVFELGDMPRAFPLLPEFEHRGIRRRSWRGYLIIYRVMQDRVVVLRVLHGARDYNLLLIPDEWIT
jgi:plasmid stabilization system protein ParE